MGGAPRPLTLYFKMQVGTYIRSTRITRLVTAASLRRHPSVLGRSFSPLEKVFCKKCKTLRKLNLLNLPKSGNFSIGGFWRAHSPDCGMPVCASLEKGEF